MISIVSLAADAGGLLCRAARPFSRTLGRFAALVLLRGAARGRVPVTTQFDGRVRTSGRVRLDLGEHCRLGRDVFLETCEDGRICLGSHVRINAGCVLVSYDRINIGDHCLIGERVSIRDADHGMEPGELMRLQEHTAAPITIGDDVWIGCGAVILKGVNIGSGAVVAANSVVTKNVPAMAVVAGLPARVLHWREPQAALAREAIS
jgi:acetyltransferase-like isoleucine patch superfamily enzyme